MKETFNDLTLEELKVKHTELAKKMQEIRFEMVLGHVENPLEKRNLRRKIARVNTLIRQKETATGKL